MMFAVFITKIVFRFLCGTLETCVPFLFSACEMYSQTFVASSIFLKTEL